MSWQQYFNRDGKVVCVNCSASIEIGDPVASRKGRSKAKERDATRLYCLKCGDELNILTEEQVVMSLLEVSVSP